MTALSRLTRPARLVALATTTAVLLCGCVSLLPKQAPVQLYRFGQTPPTAGGPAVGVGGGQAAQGVILSQVSFPRAALGDGILTVNDDEAAYVAGARWLTPAVLMFQEDAEHAFEAQAGAVRLLDRGQLGAASALLRLDVTRFEAGYGSATAQGGHGGPTAVVSLVATLTSADGRRLLQKSIAVEAPAGEDRVSAIVAAYDKAVDDGLAQVVAWTDASVPTLARGSPSDRPAAIPAPPPAALRRGRP